MNRKLAVLLNLAVFAAASCPQSMNAVPEFAPLSRTLPLRQAIPELETSETPISKKLIPDFGQISPTLFRGGEPKEGGFEALAKMGVEIVVDLRGDRDVERKELARLGIQYVPMPWQCSFPKDRIFADFIALIRKNPGKKIFVHCRVGDDRTGMVIAAYRMIEDGWSAERAKEEMIHFGFSPIHRHLICPRLADYEEEFPKRFATKPEFEGLRSAKPDQQSK